MLERKIFCDECERIYLKKSIELKRIKYINETSLALRMMKKSSMQCNQILELVPFVRVPNLTFEPSTLPRQLTNDGRKILLFCCPLFGRLYLREFTFI